jgi:uncharacterized membrane protein YhaH (DUF805 family)
MDWFSFNGQIGRKVFIVRILVVCVTLGLLFYVASDLIYEAMITKGYFILKSTIESLMVVLCIPSVVKRLRDINWTTQVAWLFAIAGIFSVRNITLVAIYVLDDKFIPATVMVPIFVIYAAAIAILLVLIFKPGKLQYV